MKKEELELVILITEAFSNVLLEDGIGLSEANAIDEYKDKAFQLACRDRDEKLDWRNISSESLNQYYNSLSFFDAKGMRFHLPAFMIAEIKREYRFGMAFCLTHLSDYSKRQFELFNPKQREAVKSFLEYLKELPDYDFEKPTIESALEEYWSK